MTEHRPGGANALLTGALVGGALALLYAPKPGSETRKFLKKELERAREEAEDIAKHARDVADEGAHKVRLSSLEQRLKKTKEEGEDHMDGKSIGMGFLLGAAVGGAVALLYAPRPGSETRGILKTKAEHTAEEALEIAEHAKDIATERVKKAKSAAEAARREAESQGTGGSVQG